MSGVDVVGVERFGVTEVAELLVCITQIAGRHQNSLAIQSSVQLHRNRFLLLLVLYSCLAGPYAEQSAQGANERNAACETTHRIYFFACLRACGANEASH